MRNYLFSKTSGGFYHAKVNAGGIPQDAVPVSDGDYKALMQAQSEGKQIDSDAQGYPVAVDRAAAPVSELLERAKDDLRIMREPMLSAVTGIGWEASEAGDATLVQEARNIRNALRDITDDHALNAAQTYEEMRAAGVAAYRRIAAGASPAFAATFKEITGA